MQLDRTSVEWTLGFISSSSDSDLFPPSPEFEALKGAQDKLVAALVQPDLATLGYGPSKRFLVPKDELSYRRATQLDPQDSVVLTALVHQLGEGIEKRRQGNNTVYSYRFDPTHVGLYAEKSGWNEFWKAASRMASYSKFVVYCDIADFYNQIYHHTLENQLFESGFPNQAVKWIITLCASTTAAVSRGVPVGPHAIHLLAEATLIPIDDAFVENGLKFLRYADDIVIFADSEVEARKVLHTVAKTLDQQQRLQMQKSKTQIYEQADFVSKAVSMIEDQPISQNESDLLKIIRKYAGDSPYQTVWFSDISEEDWLEISEETLSAIVDRYLDAKPTDFTRLGWLYRRLAQIGHPGALKVTLSRLHELTPCLASVVSYMASVQSVPHEEWLAAGEQLIALLDNEWLADEEYYHLLLISLFSRNRALNHFPLLAQRFSRSNSSIRRQIILAASNNDAIAWLRELKEEYTSMDAWQKMAFLFAMRNFPLDERKHYISQLDETRMRPLEKVLAGVAKTK